MRQFNIGNRDPTDVRGVYTTQNTSRVETARMKQEDKANTKIIAEEW